MNNFQKYVENFCLPVEMLVICTIVIVLIYFIFPKMEK